MSAYSQQLMGAAPSSTKDRKLLRVLALIHFAYGGVMVSAVAYVAVAYTRIFPNGSSATMGPAYLPMLGGLATIVFVEGLLVIASGAALLHARYRALSQVVAALCCINFPAGTLLGIWTLTTLKRGSVADLYRAQDGGGSASQATARDQHAWWQ